MKYIFGFNASMVNSIREAAFLFSFFRLITFFEPSFISSNPII